MKPHRTDTVSLSFGTIFLLIAGWWAASKVVNLAPVRLGWLIAGALIVFGMIGLLGAIRSGRRPEPVPATVGPPVEEQHGDLPPELHAEIVRELLDDPAEKFDREHSAPTHSPASAPAPGSGQSPGSAQSTASVQSPGSAQWPAPPAPGAAARPEPHTD